MQNKKKYQAPQLEKVGSIRKLTLETGSAANIHVKMFSYL